MTARNARAARGARSAGLALALLGTAALAPPAAARGARVSLVAGFESVYDDNVLGYSDFQLREFAAGTHPLRYALESSDDGVLSPSLALIWMLDQGRGRRHALRVRGDGVFHARNGTADYRSLSARWTESFVRDRRLSAGYYRIGHYYLRQLRDEDLPPALLDYRYQRGAFDLQIASASWRQRVPSRASAGLAYQFERRDYVPAFRERDSDTHQGELQVEWDRLPKRGDLELHLGYRASTARASDGDEPAGVLDDDDLSYHGLEGSAEGHMEFKRAGPWRLGGDLTVELSERKFDSKLVTDRYHYGRRDVLVAAVAGVRAAYRPHWSLGGFYRLENNTARLGASAPPSSDSGSYRQNQVGLSLEWAGDVWRSGAAGRGASAE